mgnify:CR=1 FL=1
MGKNQVAPFVAEACFLLFSNGLLYTVCAV